VLIALGGLPGVGKSALAKALARRIGAVHLRIDTIEQALRNAGREVSGPEGYLVARDLAADNLRSGHTVIVDAVNPLETTRDYLLIRFEDVRFNLDLPASRFELELPSDVNVIQF